MSELIPAVPGHVATFRVTDGDGQQQYDLPVLAWDAAGYPMVLAEGGKRLVGANTLPGYVGAYEDPNPGVVAVAPAPGWRVAYLPKEGEPWSEPLIGWAVRTDGSVKPLVVDRTGFVAEADCADDSCGVFRVECHDE